MDKQLDEMTSKVIGAMRGYMLRSVSGLVKRLEELERRQPEKGEKGDPGDRGLPGADGVDGKDADMDALKSLALERVEQAIQAIPAPKDGRDGIDGKDADPEMIQAEVKRHVESVLASWPRPRDGVDGKSVDMADVQAAIEAATQKAVSAIPVPKDGEPGRDGRDGDPGRDALRLEVLESIDVERRYQRGTYAYWRGGTIRAFRGTDPIGDGPIEKAGWHVVMNGTASKTVEHSDDLRTIVFREEMTDGTVLEKTVHVPVVIDRGIYKGDRDYATGDAVTWDNSTWIAQRTSKSEAPGSSDAWRLAARKGRDGRDGLKGEKGERGAEGKAGRDMTQMTMDGRRY